MDESTVVTIDQINELIEQIDNNTKTLKQQYDDVFIKYTAALGSLQYYKDQVKTLTMASRGITSIDFSEMMYDDNKAVESLQVLSGSNSTVTTTDDILNGAQRLSMVVIENEPGKFTNIRRDSAGSYIISHYTNDKSSVTIPFKITNPFDFNTFSFTKSSENNIQVRISSSQYNADMIVFPSLINEHEITMFIDFSEELFLENNTNEYSEYAYIQTVKIDKIVTGNITTEANFTTIQKLEKYSSDYIIKNVKINDGYNFGNDFYSAILIEFARSEENAKNGVFFKSVVVPQTGTLNEVINEYAGTAEQWIRLSISDNIKPILLKNIKIQYSVR